MKIDDICYQRSYHFDLNIDGKNYSFVCKEYKTENYVDIEYDAKGYGICFRAPVSVLDNFEKVLEPIKTNFEKILKMDFEGKLNHEESTIN